MREIKFRLRLKAIMNVGSYEAGEECIIVNEIFQPINGLAFDPLADGFEILSADQFTGLKDKNKNDIYEGDIVERRYYHNNPPSKRPKIKFILAKLQVVFIGGEFTLDDNSIRSTDYGTTFNKWWGDGCEIIGNIYENATLVQ